MAINAHRSMGVGYFMFPLGTQNTKSRAIAFSYIQQFTLLNFIGRDNDITSG
jgi:hypothetical protein